MVVEHHGGSIASPDEVVRRMPHGTAILVLPAQPERLRRHRDHVGIRIQHHQPVPLQSRLIAHVLTAAGEVPQARKAPLAATRRELTYRPSPLERKTPAQRQRSSLTFTGRVHVDQLEPIARPRRRHRSRSVHRHLPSLKQPSICLNLNGRNSEMPQTRWQCLTSTGRRHPDSARSSAR